MKNVEKLRAKFHNETGYQWQTPNYIDWLEEKALKPKVVVSSYTQKGREKIYDKDIISDEYQTSHKNLDGLSTLHISVKAL